MHSAIYEGWVRHRRVSPVENSFRYSIFLMYLDLAEVDDVFKGRRLWSAGRFNIAYLRRKDHMGDPAVPLDTIVRDLVEKKTGKRPSGSIRILTHLRYFGHNFNPVSFYYCYDKGGTFVETIVAEIHNTPWSERFCYVLDESRNEGTRNEKRFRFPKAFHVSPFMDMSLNYDWRFTEPGDSVNVHMISLKDGREIFEADLTVERRVITTSNLNRVLVRYPLMTIKVIVAIYWQALRLWHKGAPFYAHPTKGA